MKARLLRFSKVLTLLLAVLFSTLLLQEYVLCSTDHNRERVKGFYLEDKDSVDVVLIGASEVYSDFAPGYAYERHGVTGYLFATQANSILTTKLQIQETLKHQSPKLILVELNSVLYANDKNQAKEANIRHLVDHLPLNADKLAFLGELSPEHPEEYPFRCFIPIIRSGVKINLGENLNLVSVVHLNEPNIIVHRNNVPNVSAKRDFQKLQRIGVLFVTGKSVNKVLQIPKDGLRQVGIFRFEIRVTGNPIELPDL